jgi:hypothetical protein
MQPRSRSKPGFGNIADDAMALRSPTKQTLRN